MNVPRTTPFSDALAAEVRAEMARQNKTVTRLGNLLGFSQPYASRRLNGHDPFKLPEVEVIADWLGVPASELVRRCERSQEIQPAATDGAA